jgi:16S rRNA (cytosine967-C5)-methyltransferase
LSNPSHNLHFNLVKAVAESLHIIFKENKYADKVIEKTLKSDARWGSRDRKFIAETTYEIVRWKRLVQFVLDPESENNENTWHWVAAWLMLSGQAIPKWKEWESLDPTKLKIAYEKAQNIPQIKQSIPDWLYNKGLQELGNNWNNELTCLNSQAQVVIRANTLKNKPKRLQQELINVGINNFIREDFEQAIVLEKRQNLFQLPHFQRGLFEVQDAGSQLIAPFLGVQPGMRVIDACAGAGGKSLHLAALLQNSGKIISMDVEQWKLDELTKRAKRAEAHNIETKLIEDSKTIKRLENSADRLLLDVPCSGLGVLKRNPDAKWKLTEQALEQVQITQREILSSYTKMLKNGGEVVYATCSILPSENRNQVDWFLENSKGEFELLQERIVLPSEGFDGFYMVKMRKL